MGDELPSKEERTRALRRSGYYLNRASVHFDQRVAFQRLDDRGQLALEDVPQFPHPYVPRPHQHQFPWTLVQQV
jgi:hypothetical protein